MEIQQQHSPRRVSILVWIMLFGLLNCSLVMQRKLPNSCLLPSIFPLCLLNEEDLHHLFFSCPYSAKCWGSLFSLFEVSWVFNRTFSPNVRQIILGPLMKKGPRLLWTNLAKSLFAEIWFERVFHDKFMSWSDRMHIAKRKAAA